MKIESIIKRANGTRAEIGGTEYHFAPLADGAHVAEVEEAEHIERFLAIPEGYRIYREPKPEQEQDGEPDQDASDAEQGQKPARRTRKKPEQEQDGAE